jgi:hypothetical protein
MMMGRHKVNLNDQEYSDLLDDYKDHVLNDFEKHNKNTAITAIQWNCTEDLMKKKLIKWKKIELNVDEEKEKIIKIYNETKSMRLTHKRLGIAYNTLNKKFKQYGIKKIHNCIIDTKYLNILNDENQLTEFYFYCKNNDKKDAAKKFNISVYYVNKILENGVAR